MQDTPSHADMIPVADLRRGSARRFMLDPDAAGRAALAQELGLVALRKLRFEGELAPEGKTGWRLQAKLGATVVQSCVVTLEPVTTRIDGPVTRLFLPQSEIEMPEPGSEVEVPEDDTTDPLGTVIPLGDIMAEALALALPAYPRKPDAELGSVQAAAEGVDPIRDEDLKPFAALGALKAKLEGPDDT